MDAFLRRHYPHQVQRDSLTRSARSRTPASLQRYHRNNGRIALLAMNLEQARTNMVEQQIRTWEVLDQEVLDLLYVVPREEFVPAPHRALAFSDIEIPIGEGRAHVAAEARGARAAGARDPQVRPRAGGRHRQRLPHGAAGAPRRPASSRSRSGRRSRHSAAPTSSATAATTDAARSATLRAAGRATHPTTSIVLTGSTPVLPQRVPRAARARRAPVRRGGRGAGDDRAAGHLHRARGLAQRGSLRNRDRTAR